MSPRQSTSPARPSPSDLSPAALRARGRASLLGQPPAPDMAAPSSPGDFDLNPELMEWAARQPPPRAAAVLIPVMMRETLTVLFTERTEHLPAHAGQISFPGGKIDDSDDGPLATAVREANEEVGIAPETIEPIGYLDPYRTGTGFCIIPVVALVAPTASVRPNPGEVADVFEVPLAFLLDPANYLRHEREWQGRQRAFYAVPFENRYIWGATAGMLKNLATRLGQP